jgi:hypothetical protein
MTTDVPQLQGKLYVDGELVGRVSAAANGTASADDLPTQIAKLKDLHAAGALSDEEFAAAKQRLLSGPSGDG